MPVVGLGGLFFRASDPDGLAAWYADHLGVGAGPDGWSWATEAGPMVFAPFPADSDHFPAERRFMVNFRVSDLDALLDGLRAGGVEVVTDPSWDDPATGRFARVHDPEGNPVELWEPPAVGWRPSGERPR